MTDRIASFVVVLENDLRDDDAKEIADAIAQLRGVLEVRNGPIAGHEHLVAKAQARGEIFGRITKVISEYV